MDRLLVFDDPEVQKKKKNCSGDILNMVFYSGFGVCAGFDLGLVHFFEVGASPYF